MICGERMALRAVEPGFDPERHLDRLGDGLRLWLDRPWLCDGRNIEPFDDAADQLGVRHRP